MSGETCWLQMTRNHIRQRQRWASFQSPHSWEWRNRKYHELIHQVYRYKPRLPGNTLAGISGSYLRARRGHMRGSYPRALPTNSLILVARRIMLEHSKHSITSCNTTASFTAKASFSSLPPTHSSCQMQLFPSPQDTCFPNPGLWLRPSSSLMDSAQPPRSLLFPTVLPDHSRPRCFHSSSTLSSLKAHTLLCSNYTSQRLFSLYLPKITLLQRGKKAEVPFLASNSVSISEATPLPVS